MKKSLKQDIMNPINALFNRNAKGADWYAWCYDNDKSKILSGEFVYLSEGEPTAEKFDGYIDLTTKKITEF